MSKPETKKSTTQSDLAGFEQLTSVRLMDGPAAARARRRIGRRMVGPQPIELSGTAPWVLG